MNNKTWNEFWGEFLQVTFHKGHPELWPSRERKALWALKHLGIPKGSSILNLGCGDGIVDIWISRMGYNVTAVDRNSRVLEIAQDADDTKKVKFISSDLTTVNFESQSFDAILMMETTGLMNKSSELELFQKAHSWLKPDGKLILDCPESVEHQNSWSKEFPDGRARGESSFDEVTRIQNIQFYFQAPGEEEFGIYDPYDLEKGDAPGIMRSIYPKDEMRQMLADSGFSVREIDHYYEKNFFGMLASPIKTKV